MKKFILTALAAACVAGVWAAPVGVDRAKTTATAFMKNHQGRNVTVKEVVSKNDTYYIINLNPTGWVIVSADDIADPILGYNPSGSLSWHNLPEPMTGMLDTYRGEIKALKNAGVSKRSTSWSTISSPVAISRASGMIDDLIPVNWNQPAPFNKYCPGSGTNKALVGCVAVSLAQAMAVQRYPAQPAGKVSYGSANYGLLEINFDAEKAYDWDKIISGANNYDEVARFLYHAGMAVEMNYGIEGSGVPSNLTGSRDIKALSENFGYDKNELKYYWRTQFQNKDQEWNDLVLNEISAGRAVVYCAIDTKGGYGHAFNADGYDGDGRFHINWGWGGVGNGYFPLNALKDAAMNMDYDSGHMIVIGIGSPDQVLKSIKLSDTVIDENMPAGTVVAQITVNGTTPEKTYKIEIQGAYDPTTKDYLDIPFVLDGDLIKTKSVLTASDKPIEVTVRVQDTATGTRLNSTFSITVCKLRTIAQATAMTYDRNTGDLTVKTRNGIDYTLKNAQGTTISSGKLSPVPIMTVNMSQLTEGNNTLVLTDGSNSKTINIKK